MRCCSPARVVLVLILVWVRTSFTYTHRAMSATTVNSAGSSTRNPITELLVPQRVGQRPKMSDHKHFLRAKTHFFKDLDLSTVLVKEGHGDSNFTGEWTHAHGALVHMTHVGRVELAARFQHLIHPSFESLKMKANTQCM